MEIGPRAFAKSGPELWNAIPLDIRNSSSVTAFKSSIKNHITKFAVSEKFMKALLKCTRNIFRMYCVVHELYYIVL